MAERGPDDAGAEVAPVPPAGDDDQRSLEEHQDDALRAAGKAPDEVEEYDG